MSSRTTRKAMSLRTEIDPGDDDDDDDDDGDDDDSGWCREGRRGSR